MDFLCREIEISEIKPQLLKSVYFWWGTPSMLSSQQIHRILDTLESKFWFENWIEISLETTPENVNLWSITDWKNTWVNRISMGVQSLNNMALKEVGRESNAEIFRALSVLDKGVISNVSVDFILGLPFVKSMELQNSIWYMIDNHDIIKHFSVYMLEDYYEVPEEPDSKFQHVKYPVSWSKNGLSESEYLSEYISCRKLLKKSWFNSYEISNFAKKWYECKHNKAYWDHSDIAAFGLWASGFIWWTRYKNSDDFQDYYRGDKIEEEQLDQSAILLEQIMFWLRTSWFDKELLKHVSHDGYEHIKANGLIKEKKGKICLWKNGYTLLDSIILNLMK